MLDKREKVFQAFAAFLADFVRDLNHLSEDGWAVLVEGQRDENALRKLGYTGELVSVSAAGRKGHVVFGDSKRVVILTDLDREGGVLAAKFTRRLAHDGLRTSLMERRRLKHASHGVFLHIENLSRFAGDMADRGGKHEVYIPKNSCNKSTYAYHVKQKLKHE